MRGGNPTVGSSSAPDPEPLLRLTLRILEHFHIVSQKRRQLLPGQFPQTLPFAVPLLPGAVVVGSQIDADSVNIYIDTHVAPDEATEFYRQSLQNQGWQPRIEAPEEPSATLEERFGDGAKDDLWEGDEDLISPDGQASVTVDALQTEEGLTSVVLYIEAPYQREEAPHNVAAADMAKRLPRLPPPPDTEQWEVGFLGSPESAERRTDLSTHADIHTLAEHYGREIAALGWMKTGAELTNRSGWSAWQREDDKGERLYLIWLAFQVPSTSSLYSLVEQVGRQNRELPSFDPDASIATISWAE